MYLMISRKPRSKNRSKTNRLKAKAKAKNRRRVQGMRGKALGKKLAKKW
jgi:hypothetical protein